MKRYLAVCGLIGTFLIVSAAPAFAQESTECDPFSIACGYDFTFNVGPFNFDIDFESLFPPPE
ncbi:MAG: hypothetical protein LC778_10315 [Acidobacteria bacterium]|nr:hypothetical protein [Acidobacteriota bacterium]